MRTGRGIAARFTVEKERSSVRHNLPGLEGQGKSSSTIQVMMGAMRATKKAIGRPTTEATAPRPIETDGEDQQRDAHPRAGENTLYCRVHGAIPAGEAVRTKGGRSKCPIPGCLRFVGASLGKNGAGRKNGEALDLLQGFPTVIMVDPKIQALLKELAVARVRKAITETTAPSHEMDILAKLERHLATLDEIEGRLSAVEKSTRSLSAALQRVGYWLEHQGFDTRVYGLKAWILTGSEEYRKARAPEASLSSAREG